MTWKPKTLTRTQMAERRAEGVQLLEAGEKSHAEIGRYLGVSQAAVSKWHSVLKEKGRQALEMRRAPGRPRRLSDENKQRLVEKLKEGALAAGYPTEQWTQARVKEVIKREFGVVYHQNYISRLLKELGWSVQKPEPRAIERDEEMILAWVREEWPRIKKGARTWRKHRV